MNWHRIGVILAYLLVGITLVGMTLLIDLALSLFELQGWPRHMLAAAAVFAGLRVGIVLYRWRR